MSPSGCSTSSLNQVAGRRSRTYAIDNRVWHPHDFRRAFSAGNVQRGKFFSLYFISNDLSKYRLGIVVPRRLAKKAVVRNKIKRLAREHFRTNIFRANPKMVMSDTYDLVLRLNSVVGKMHLRQGVIAADICNHFNKVKEIVCWREC